MRGHSYDFGSLGHAVRDWERSHDTRGLPRRRGFLMLLAYIYGRGGGLDGMASSSVVLSPSALLFLSIFWRPRWRVGSGLGRGMGLVGGINGLCILKGFAIMEGGQYTPLVSTSAFSGSR